jgi:hypothetical protein
MKAILLNILLQVNNIKLDPFISNGLVKSEGAGLFSS